MCGLEFRVWGVGQGLGFRVQGLGLKGLGLRVEGFWGLELKDLRV